MSSTSESYFASVAGQWDEMRTEYFTDHMRDAAIERARLPDNAIVADIGTGTGFVAAGLAPLRRSGLWLRCQPADAGSCREEPGCILKYQAEACPRRRDSPARRFPGRRLCQHVSPPCAGPAKSHHGDGPPAQAGRRALHHRPGRP